MLEPQFAKDRVAALVERACRAGADAADAVYRGSSAEAVQVRLGVLEEVERSENEHVSLRVFVGQRSASVGSSDLGDAALDELVSRALAMARLAPEDRYAGLAPHDMLADLPLPDLDLHDDADPQPDQLRRLAQTAEEAARAVHGVTNSNGAGANSGREVFALATSAGFCDAFAGTMRSISASVIAGEGSEMQRDYAWRSARRLADLPDADMIGRLAGERTVARLGPGRVKSGPMPVVFDPRVGGSLIGHLLGAISGSAIARKASFLVGKDCSQVFGSDVTITDDPLRLRGPASRPFDGEGLATAARNLVSAGVLGDWLMDSAAARQLGLAPTRNAVRGHGGAPGVSASNVHMVAGTVSPGQLIADITDGVLITELIGQGANGVTGDYSRGASGFRIVDGEVAGPIAEFTIAGNLLDMFAALIPANDLEWYRSVNVPTIRIDGMTVAGD